MSEMTSSDCLFSPTSGPKPRDIQFTVTQEGKHHMVTLENLEQGKYLAYLSEKLLTDNQNIFSVS